MAIGIGQITITDVQDGALPQAEYASSISATTPPTTGWGSSVPAPQTGYYIWKRERLAYADGTYTAWDAPIRVTGDKGDSGPKGETGEQGPQGLPGQDYNMRIGDWEISTIGQGYDFLFPPIPTGMDILEVKIYQMDLGSNVRLLCNGNIVAPLNGTDGTTTWLTIPIPVAYMNFDSDNILRIEHDGGDADWGHVYKVALQYAKKGPQGDAARAITLSASSSVINMSSRGELKTQEIEITCNPSNLPIENAVWTATDEGSLAQIEVAEGVFDPYKRVLDCSLVTGDSTLIQVSINYDGDLYTGILGISKVSDGTPTPMYLEALNGLPFSTEEGPLIPGDFFLYVGPYNGPNSDPGDTGINPPYAEPNEFIYGRIYEYKGNSTWEESRKSEHFAAAQKDALDIAKNSGKYLYVAVIAAQLGLFLDLVIAGILRSANYTESSSGVPTAGFMLDGIKGLIKALGLEAYSAMIYGNLEASGFRTLQEEGGTTIGVSTISPTIWKHSEMEALIASQDTLATLSGTIEGFSFTKATRRSNQRVLLASHGYESESISAGETHYFTQLYPSKVFGLSFKCEFSGYYKGLYSNRGYWAFVAEANSNLTSAHFIRSMGESYAVNASYSFPSSAYTNFTIKHYSGALWGNRGSHVDYHKVWTNQVFTGLVLVNGETSYKVIEPEPSAYYSNSKTWTIGSYNQNSIDNYCSGTDFYNKFSSLAVGADGFCDGGQIRVNGTLYTVTRLTKNANSITFYTSGGVITVNKFQEGTSVGVYTSLAVTQAIKFKAVAGGVEVKHIFPWGTQAGSPGSYDIGTANERFNTAWLNIIDALNDVRFRKNLTVDRNISADYLNGNTVSAGNGNFTIGNFTHCAFNESSPTYYRIINSQAGSHVFASSSASVRTSATGWTKRKELYCRASGVITVVFTITSETSQQPQGRIYVNGVARGTIRTGASQQSVTFSENISVSYGDLVQLYARRADTSGTRYYSVSNFKLQSKYPNNYNFTGDLN
ncbi:MAG: collagen-like protein [Sphaerochaetaceae bacterium]|nr:collagen-like protein [uncultured Sphaerochaeta sp.]MDC7229722.1 collagen-like protein [Sphaerochaetaceae bacterium]